MPAGAPDLQAHDLPEAANKTIGPAHAKCKRAKQSGSHCSATSPARHEGLGYEDQKSGIPSSLGEIVIEDSGIRDPVPSSRGDPSH